MTLPAATHQLSALFEPRAVALIGASADPHSISARPLRLLLQHGYAGGLYPVNPRHTQLMGLRVYPTIGAVPAPVDLAMVAVPAAVVPEVLEECAAAQVRCAAVLSSGFAESGPDGQRLQQRIADIAARTGMRVCGPNSEGLYNPANQLCATFSPAVDQEHGFVPTESGPIAVVSQSGGLCFAIPNHGREMGLGFGAVISTGNEADLGWADYVDYLLDQPSVQVVLGFVEAFRQPARLIDVARKAAHLKKPLVVAKIGRSEAGRRAAASHTGSLVGADKAYSAVLRQLGVLRVDDVDEMLDLATYFSVGRLPAGRRIAVLTASGGAGAWLTDACAARGFEFPAPDPADQETIRSFIPDYGSVANPVDITAQAALAGGFERALGLLVRSRRFDTVVPVGNLVRGERFFETLGDLRAAVENTDAQTAVAFYSYTRPARAVIGALAEIGIPCYTTPRRAARALSGAVGYAEFLRRVDQVAVLDETRRSPACWPAPTSRLSEAGAHAYLAPLGIPSPASCLARSADEAVAHFEALGAGPVALKVQSADLAHKTDVGGVRLGLRSADEVRSAFEEITASIRAARPEANVDGLLVQCMAPDGVELLVAARRDAQLGPLVVVGLGGVLVEVLSDVALRLAPVSQSEAVSMLDDLRGAALLRGVRGRTPADIEALATTVARVSEMAVALPPSVTNVEINPLVVLARGEGVLMLDAAIEIEGGQTR